MQIKGRLETLRRLNRDPGWVNGEIFRLVCSPPLAVLAYEGLKSKQGNMTNDRRRVVTRIMRANRWRSRNPVRRLVRVLVFGPDRSWAFRSRGDKRHSDNRRVEARSPIAFALRKCARTGLWPEVWVRDVFDCEGG